MKKFVSCFLAMILLMSAPLAFAEQAFKGSVIVTSSITVDRDVANEVMDAFGAAKEVKEVVDPALAVLNTVNDKLTIAENGFEYKLYLKDSELLSLAGGANDEGLILLSSLIPDYAITLSAETAQLLTAASGFISQIKNTMDADKQKKEEAINLAEAEVFAPYIETFVNAIPAALLFGTPEQSSYVFREEHTYNTKIPITIDAKVIGDTLTNIVTNMSKDEAALEVLKKANVSVEDLQGIPYIAELLPALNMAIYAVLDDKGNETAPDKCFEASIVMPGQTAAIASFDLQILPEHLDAGFSMPLSEDGTGIYALLSVVPFNEETATGAGALSFNIMGSNYSALYEVGPTEDKSSLVFTDSIYVINTEKPLASGVTIIEKSDVQMLDLARGKREAFALENMFSEEGGDMLTKMVTSIMFSGFSIMSTATEAVPEVSVLIEKLSGQ